MGSYSISFEFRLDNEYSLCDEVVKQSCSPLPRKSVSEKYQNTVFSLILAKAINSTLDVSLRLAYNIV